MTSIESLGAAVLRGGVYVTPSDDRSYRTLTLDNGLRVLLVSDAGSDSAAAVMCVRAGSLQDPPELPGLAHFTEHLLFMGTETHPEEDAYNRFVAANGGETNAWTAAEETVYYCTTSKPLTALEGLLDIFAPFFTCPLFLESCVDRELRAVASEHDKNLQSDLWRLMQLERSTSMPGHPYSGFGTGDLRTLRDTPAAQGINVREEVIKFWKRHYSAGRMALGIAGPQSLDTLEAWTRARFSGIANNGSELPVDSRHPFTGRTGILQRVVPIKDSRSLRMVWPLPELETQWRSKPETYIANLLGHEGEGSVLALLKARGWATGLSAYTATENAGFSTFMVDIKLSPAGYAAVDAVVAVVFAYLGLLRAGPPLEWLNSEIVQNDANTFRFQGKCRALESAFKASTLLKLPSEYVLAGGQLHWEFDAATISSLLERLTPASVRLLLLSKDIPTEELGLVEPWYGTKYSEAPLGDKVALWEEASRVYADTARAMGLASPTAETAAALWAARSESGGAGPSASGSAAAGTAGRAEIADASGSAASTEALPPPPHAEPSAWRAWVAALAPALAYPAPNDFLPSDFTHRHPNFGCSCSSTAALPGAAEGEPLQQHLHTCAAAAAAAASPPSPAAAAPASPRVVVPQVIRNDAFSTLWWHLDDTFGEPKASLYAVLWLPEAGGSARRVALAAAYVALLQLSLGELAYPASIAGLHYTVTAAGASVRFNVGGFSHKLGTLVAAVAKRAVALTFTDAQFELVIEEAIRARANNAKLPPTWQAGLAIRANLLEPDYHYTELAAALKRLRPDHLRAFIRGELFDSARITATVTGNVSRDEALSIFDALAVPLSALAAPAAPAEVLTLESRMAALPSPLQVVAAGSGEAPAAAPPHAGLEIRLIRPNSNPTDNNAAVVVLCQLGRHGFTRGADAVARLLEQVLYEPFFDKLRTKQQLGYIVQAHKRLDAPVADLRFVVQSSSLTDTDALLQRIESFLVDFRGELAALTPEAFEEQKEAVATALLETDKSLKDLASRLSEAALSTYYFRFQPEAAAAVRALTHAQLLEAYDDYVMPSGKHRAALVVTVAKGTDAEAPAASGEEAAPEAGADAYVPAAPVTWDVEVPSGPGLELVRALGMGSIASSAGGASSWGGFPSIPWPALQAAYEASVGVPLPARPESVPPSRPLRLIINATGERPLRHLLPLYGTNAAGRAAAWEAGALKL